MLHPSNAYQHALAHASTAAVQYGTADSYAAF
jgi:hypothetical protein